MIEKHNDSQLAVNMALKIQQMVLVAGLAPCGWKDSWDPIETNPGLERLVTTRFVTGRYKPPGNRFPKPK